MLSSGVTGLDTSSAAARTLIANTLQMKSCRHARIVTESGIAGFVSFDGGTTKHRLPSNQSVHTFYDIVGLVSVLLYRDGATDVTAVYASVW